MKRYYSWGKYSLTVGVCLIIMFGMAACRQTVVDSGMTEHQSSSAQEYAPEDTLPVATTEEQSQEMMTTEEFSTTETVDTEAASTEMTTTEVPTTEVPTTEYPTTETPTTEAPTPQSVSAKVRGSHYIGDTLSAADFTITVTMSDGSTRKNPAGWSADKLYLEGEENGITITYQGVSTMITVPASERPVETQPPVTESPTEAPAEVSTEAPSQAPTQPPAQDTGSSDSGLSLRRDAAEEAFRIQNDLIVQNGGTPLTWSETFYQQACQRAKEIVSDFSHDGFYNTTAYAENIAMGSYDANVMVQAWYNSDGHRSNMLYGWSYGAIACYGNYWVALFGPTEG